MGNSCMSVFPKPRAWEQQDWNKTMDFFLIRWFLTATSGTKPIIVSAGHVYILLHQREKWRSTIQYGYSKTGNSCTSVFPNTHAWEQQEWNKTMRQRKTHRREAWVRKKAQRARIKEVPTAYHILIKIQ